MDISRIVQSPLWYDKERDMHISSLTLGERCKRPHRIIEMTGVIKKLQIEQDDNLVIFVIPTDEKRNTERVTGNKIDLLYNFINDIQKYVDKIFFEWDTTAFGILSNQEIETKKKTRRDIIEKCDNDDMCIRINIPREINPQDKTSEYFTEIYNKNNKKINMNRFNELCNKQFKGQITIAHVEFSKTGYQTILLLNNLVLCDKL